MSIKDYLIFMIFRRINCISVYYLLILILCTFFQVYLFKSGPHTRRHFRIIDVANNIAMNTSFSAENFVQNLYLEGSTVTCDMSFPNFTREERPPFYDEEKYRRGRNFFERNYAAVILSKIIALIIGLADPIFNAILRKTNKSSTPETALNRYRATIDHIQIWYRDDFSAGSKGWRSMKIVKTLHNNASEMVNRKGMSRITQKDMALVQMGFIIIVLLKPKRVGIFNARDEDFEGFIHIWRNIGNMLGIEDRFNICRESLQETIEICRALLDRLYPLYLQEMNGDNYTVMVTAFILGIRKYIPFFQVDYLSAFSKDILHCCRYNTAPLELLEIDENVMKKAKRMVYVINLMRFNIIRIIYNTIVKFCNKIVKVLKYFRWVP